MLTRYRCRSLLHLGQPRLQTLVGHKLSRRERNQFQSNSKEVILLVGEPLSGHEARFLRKLYAELEPIGALVLANFHAGEYQIDFVVVTESLAAILELKHLPQPVFGRQNGQWMVEDQSGRRVPYPGSNPWPQTLQQKYALSDEMRRYKGDPTRRFFTEFDAYVCIDPKIHLCLLYIHPRAPNLISLRSAGRNRLNRPGFFRRLF